MKAHPTALIESGATIAPDAQIGPYCIIGAEAEIGARTILQSHVIIEGAVRVGEENVIGHGAIIGAPPQDLNFKSSTRSRVEIGARNVIRELCTIHRGTVEESATKIGDDNFLMAGAHLGHNCALGHGVIIANNCLLAGYVEVHDRAFIGGGTTLHQNLRVGRLVMVQGSSAFGKDLPPFVLAAERNAVFGLNVIGMRRAGFDAAERAEITRAFKLLYTSGLNVKQALEEADATEFGPLAREFFAFVRAAKKRGIVPYHRAGKSSERE